MLLHSVSWHGCSAPHCHPGTKANDASSGHVITWLWKQVTATGGTQCVWKLTAEAYNHFYLQVIPDQVARPCLSSEGAQTYPCSRKDRQHIVLMRVTITPQKDCSLTHLYPHLKQSVNLVRDKGHHSLWGFLLWCLSTMFLSTLKESSPLSKEQVCHMI